MLHAALYCPAYRGPLSGVLTRVWWFWQVWDTAQCKCVHTLRGHKQPVQRIAICGSRLYSTAGRDIRVWDVATFECLQVIRTQQDCGALLAMTAAPDGTVYVGGQVCSPATLSPPASCLKCLERSRLGLLHYAADGFRTGLLIQSTSACILLLWKHTGL